MRGDRGKPVTTIWQRFLRRNEKHGKRVWKWQKNPGQCFFIDIDFKQNTLQLTAVVHKL